MDDVPQNAMLFFEQHPESYPLYEAFYEKLMSRFPEARAKVQKSQIITVIFSPVFPSCG